MSAPRTGRPRAAVDADQVTIREMIEYVDRREAPIFIAIEKLSTQIDQHNDYHRTILERALDAAASRTWQVRGIAVAAVGGIGGLVLGIITAARGGH